MRAPAVRLLVVALFLTLCGPSLAACGPSMTVSPTASAAVPDALRGLPATTVRIGGRTLRVAVADRVESRRRGLTGVGDLGSLDGLLFVYPGPVETTFHMRDVPIPLDIAFFDADGRAMAVVAMAVCDAEPCPAYRAPGAFRWALETEAGGLADLEPGEVLRVEPWPTLRPSFGGRS